MLILILILFQVIQPPGNAFKVDENSQTEVVLNGLLPNQQYFLRVSLNIQENDQFVVSDILSGTTPQLPLVNCVANCDVVLRKIDVKLTVDDIKSDSAFISWRFFSFDEKQYIDGVQIRFNTLTNGSLSSGIPGTTPFIHRDTNFFLLADLKADTEYQVDLYLIPVPKSKIELTSESYQTFKTPAPQEGKRLKLYQNPYKTKFTSFQILSISNCP